MQQLSGLDAAFLAMESTRVYAHVGSVCLLDPSTAPQPLTLDQLTAHIASRQHLLPLLRRRLVTVPFGLDQPEVDALGTAGYRPHTYYQSNPALRQALRAVASGAFSGGNHSAFAPLVDSLLHHDTYRVLADYQSYIEAQDRVERAYRDPRAWTRSAVLNVARSGFFSSDRSIRDYIDRIWHTTAVPRRLTQFDPGL